MAETVTVIDIVAQVSDQTASGAASATENVTKLEKTMQKVQNEINKIQKMSKLELTMYAIDNASKGIDGVLRKGASLAGKVWSVTMKAVDLVTAPVQGIINLLKNPVFQMASIAGISLGAADTINTYMGFEEQIANLKAITGATTDEMNQMEEGIRKIALTSNKSVTEIATNAKMLAESGGDMGLMFAQLEHGVNLATATQTDMATTLDFLGSAMKTFGVEAEDTQSVADSLAYTTRLANVELSQLAESYVNVGGSAANAGLSIDDVNSALVTLSNAGLKGGSAGTSLNTMLNNLTAPTDKAAGSLDELGVSLYDAAGESRDMFDIMSDLEKTLGGMSDQKRNNYLSDIFDTVALKGWNYLVADGIDSIRELSDELPGAGDDFKGLGTAAGMADIQLDTMSGSFSLLRRAADEFKITIGDKAAPYIRQFAGWLTDKIPGATEAAVWAFDWAEEKAKNLLNTIKDFSGTDEWANADFFGKVSIAWDTLIGEPFSEWWENKGKAKVADIAGNIGSGIGTAFNYGISALFGLDTGEIIDDGVNIGKSFADGFSKGIEGIDWKQVMSGLGDAAIEVIKLIFSNNITGGIAGAWLAGKTLGAVSGIYKAGTGISSALSTPLLGAGGTAATAAGAGGAATVGTAAATVGGIALGAAGVVSAVSDFSKAARTYNDNLEEKVSGGVKLGMVAAGAAIGTAIAGPVGTAVGAGVGGLVALAAGSELGGAIAGWIDGTGKIYNTTEELLKAAEAYDKVTEKAGLTKSALENYYDAAENLQNNSLSDAERGGVLDAQQSALEKIQDLYPGLITQYDVELGKLDEKLKLIDEISKAEERLARNELESAVIKGRENVGETTLKLGEAERNLTGWQNDIQNLWKNEAERVGIQSDWLALNNQADLGLISASERASGVQELYKRIQDYAEETGLNILPGEAMLRNYKGRTGKDEFSLKYALENLDRGAMGDEISKLEASIAKEQEKFDKLMNSQTTQYSNEIKLMDIDYGGGLAEDIERFKELEKIIDEFDPANLSEANTTLMEEYELLSEKVGDYIKGVEDLNRQYGNIPGKLETVYTFEFDLKNPEVMESVRQFISDTSGFGMDVFDTIINKNNKPQESSFPAKSDNLLTPWWNRGYASGTPSASSGLHWVGENGPELIDFSGGERVYNAADSARIRDSANPIVPASAGGGSNPISVQVGDIKWEVNIDGAATTADIIQILKDNIKELTDDIAYNIAVALQQTFANTPSSAWER